MVWTKLKLINVTNSLYRSNMKLLLPRFIHFASRRDSVQLHASLFKTDLDTPISLNSSLAYSMQFTKIRFINKLCCFTRHFSETNKPVSEIHFLELCEETLTDICEHFEELVETEDVLKSGDISYSDGVITAYLGSEIGTYVINRQTPNQQIWLSSPKSGPKRFDYDGSKWIYKHDNTSLHSLLDSEIRAIVNSNSVNFSSRVSKK